jgi:hypothetical protein
VIDVVRAKSGILKCLVPCLFTEGDVSRFPESVLPDVGVDLTGRAPPFRELCGGARNGYELGYDRSLAHQKGCAGVAAL